MLQPSSSISMPPSSSNFSLTHLSKNHIINDMIQQVRSKLMITLKDTKRASDDSLVVARPLALILDYHGLKVLSSCCTTTDLLEEDIGMIDLLENEERELAVDYDAVYLVQPTPDSIDRIIRDFKDYDTKKKKKFRPKYRSAFVYCTSPMPKRVMDQLASVSEFVNRCGALVDFFQDYVCFDERSYHCDQPLAINALSSQSSDSDYFINAHLNSILSVCTMLNEKPKVIRYQAGTRSGFPKLIAEKLMHNLDLVYSEASTDKPPQSNCKVLIVDRSIDIASLLVHDFHYEDMVLDCLDSAGVEWSLGEDDDDYDNDDATAASRVSVVPSYLYKYDDNGQIKEERMLLSERCDEMWAKYRHMHIAEVSSLIQEDIQQFNDTSKISKLQSNTDDDHDDDDSGIKKNGLKDGVEAIRELPIYKEKLKKYSMHVDIINACNNCIETLSLGQVAEVEQALATGVDDDGHLVSSDTILPKINHLLSSNTIGDEQKLRLIALYLTYMDGCTEPFADSLLKRAGLDSVMEYAVKKLLKLRLHQAHDVASSSSSATASSNKQSHIYAKNKGILKRNKERAKKAPIRISRFVPTLGQVIEDVENNMVDEEAYPNVCPARNSVAASGRTAYASASVRGRASGRGGEGRRGGSLSPGRSAFKSLGTAANWGGWDSPRGIGGRYYHHQGGGSSKDTLIVCVLGGITLPEIRQGFDISSQLGIDVIIGGSVVLTAKRLVEALVSGPDNNNDNEMVMATGSV